MIPEPTPLDASLDRRYEFWASVGAVESDVITYLISPTLTGGPHWPTTRQAYRIVRRGDSIVIASDGLSDPFPNVPNGSNGFELELFVETADIAPEYAGKPGYINDIKDSWAFELIKHVADTVADAGGIRPQLEHFEVLSMELPGFSRSRALARQLPPGFATSDDAIGILIGGPSPDFPDTIPGMPLSPVTIVPVTLLRANELDLLRSGKTDALAFAAKLAASGTGHRIDLRRPDLL